MLNPTVRSPSSSSNASTSSISASESASRSAAKSESMTMRSSSISRISARRSRMIRNTSSGPIGLRSTWVSAGIGDGSLDPRDDFGLHTFLRAAHGIADGARIRRSVGDHADAVDAQQDAATLGIGVELVGLFEQRGHHDLRRLPEL